MSPSDKQIIDVLYLYYLDRQEDVGYYVNWDTHLVMHGQTAAYVAMMYKTEDQRNRILDAARNKAEKLRNSKLWKVLK